MDRRKFIQAGALASSTLALGLTSCTTATPESSDTGLTDITKDISFINQDDRKSRIEKAMLLMNENGYDAIFLESGTSLNYFAGIKWWPSERLSGIIIHNDGTLDYICPAFEEHRFEELITNQGNVSIWQEHESPFQLVADLFKAKHSSDGTLGIEENVRFFQSNGIAKQLGQATIKSATPITAGCRSIKSVKELALLKKANEITLAAYKYAFDNMEEGMSQYALSAKVGEACTALGASETGWAGTMFGEYSAFPHGSSTAQQLKEGDLVLIDGGCKLDGYQANITRTTVFGQPTQRQRDIWDIVKEAQTAVYAQAKAGVPCERLDATARAVVNKHGFGAGYENFFHRVGHGIGMDFHEWEYLVKGNKTPMQPGMCFSNEPMICLYKNNGEGEFGVRLEDHFYMGEQGPVWFTEPSHSLDDPFGLEA